MPKKEIRAIDVMSLAKVAAVINAIYGFFVGLLLSVGFFIWPVPGIQQISRMIGAGLIIVVPLIYGIIGFLAGAIFAFIYNFVASKVGGVKIRLK